MDIEFKVKNNFQGSAVWRKTLFEQQEYNCFFFFRMLAKQDTVKNLISMSCAESNKIIPKKMDWENIQ
jgi:hypothetical protein